VDVRRHDAWRERGIPADEAAKWRAAGFRADPAYLLRSLGATPAISRQLLRVLRDQDAVVEAVEQIVIRDPSVAPRSTEDVEHALDALVAMTACGLLPAEALAWMNAGWAPLEAAEWFGAGFGPANAKAWHDAGFAPQEARLWRRDLFGSRQAAQWRMLGETPERARAVAALFTAANVPVTDALRLLERGHSFEEIIGAVRAHAAATAAARATS
jgi:hypothetical protein